MPKAIAPLTVVAIKAAAPGQTLYDGKGLALTIDASGNKRWFWRYYRPDGRRNMLGFGGFPEISLAEARTKAQAARETLAQGIDPAEAKKNIKREAVVASRGTFKAMAEDWYVHKSKEWATETARKARLVLDGYLLPAVGNKQVADLSTADIKPVLVSMSESTPVLARKARQYCNLIIEYAIQEGLRDDGKLLSLRGVLPRIPKSHFPAVTKIAGLSRLMKTIDGIGSFQSRAALLLCIYTASRPGVVAGMLWEEIDLDRREWHIPASRMKTGGDHISPLPRQAIALLKELRNQAGTSRFVFPGLRDPAEHHLHRDSLSKILRDNGLRGVTVTHGFRATFRTIARERLRADPDVLEAQLAHAKKGETQAAYDRTQFLEERHALLQKWADFLHEQAQDEEVLPLIRTSAKG